MSGVFAVIAGFFESLVETVAELLFFSDDDDFPPTAGAIVT